MDLARWIAGDIVDVTARRTGGVLRAAGYDVDDVYSVLLGFEGGAHGTAMLGWSLPDSTAGRGISGFTVVGESGFLRVEQDNTGLLGYDQGGPLALDTWYAPRVHGRSVGALANEVHHFLDVVAGTAAPLCTANDGYEAVRASLAVEQSAQEGRTIRLDNRQQGELAR
jgi:predicted dehydrogenase